MADDFDRRGRSAGFRKVRPGEISRIERVITWPSVAALDKIARALRNIQKGFFL
jgi:hypothetical protein